MTVAGALTFRASATCEHPLRIVARFGLANARFAVPNALAFGFPVSGRL